MILIRTDVRSFLACPKNRKYGDLNVCISFVKFKFFFVSLCLCLSLSLFLCLSIFVSLSLSLYLCLSVSVCLCLSLSLSLFLCLCLSIFVSLSLSLYLCLSVSVCLCLSLSFSVSVSLSLSLCLCLSVSVSLSLSLSVSLSLSLYLCLSLSVSLSLSTPTPHSAPTAPLLTLIMRHSYAAMSSKTDSAFSALHRRAIKLSFPDATADQKLKDMRIKSLHKRLEYNMGLFMYMILNNETPEYIHLTCTHALPYASPTIRNLVCRWPRIDKYNFLCCLSMEQPTSDSHILSFIQLLQAKPSCTP